MTKPALGVLGGMGALASAEFVKTIYEFSGELSAREQAAPVVDSFVAGCTELHLLAKQFGPSGHGQRGYGCIDPLTIIARQIVEQYQYDI